MTLQFIPLRLWELATEIYDDEGAKIWFESRNRLLDGRRPIELARTEQGEEQVFQLLNQLAHGTF